MEFISVKEAAVKFDISERRVQKLCETHRIDGAEMVSGVWLIPQKARKPQDERVILSLSENDYMTLKEVCNELSISIATGRNWVKLGKIVPEYTEKKTSFFSREYIAQFKMDIQQGAKAVLKSRRNKKYVSGNALYNSYVSEKCTNIQNVQDLLTVLDESQLSVDDELIQILVADCAIKLFIQKYQIKTEDTGCVLLQYLDEKIDFGKYNILFDELLCDKPKIYNLIREHVQLFCNCYNYEEREDIIGLLYISCKNIGNRKATGSYYTPTKVVEQLISKVVEKNKNGKKILDPCCGTGNFLLQLPDEFKMNQIYGNDIDEISVKITRLNMALKFNNADISILYSNITTRNYLSEYHGSEFDLIIGNPPWGYVFTDKEKSYMRDTYKSAKGKNMESYDLFIEKALKSLKENGVLSFVLPEAILNVKTHMPIRKIIVTGNSIQYVKFLGNAFDKVQCPCIILQIKHTNMPISSIGMEIDQNGRNFKLMKSWVITPEVFSFTMSDAEQEVMEKIRNNSDKAYLQGNALFALGIVTGDNKRYITHKKNSNNEMILKGSDICKYNIRNAGSYIEFQPEFFQQVAPIEFYRAPEKLLYRFVCNQLVFAYDDKQTLSLNSCNVVIPQIFGLDMKYILAVLNSRAAQFYYQKRFNSVKVLRKHIEQIPIPVIPNEQQRELIFLINDIQDEENKDEIIKKYEEIDERVRLLYGINELEYNIIKQSVDGKNKFLF